MSRPKKTRKERIANARTANRGARGALLGLAKVLPVPDEFVEKANQICDVVDDAIDSVEGELEGSSSAEPAGKVTQTGRGKRGGGGR